MRTEDEIVTLPVVRERSSVVLTPVMDVQTAMSRLRQFQEFCASYLSESADGGNDGGDYGIIPGTKKKTLLKSGADKLCEVYGLYDEYVVISTVEDWDKGLFDYTLKCILKSRRDDSMVGAGMGSCSSFESKYRWRDSQRKCPSCGQAAIIKGKDFKGDGQPTGWLCFAKKGGCGTKFKDGDQSIEGQIMGRTDNPDIIDSKNTVLKMAKKRAKIDATIGVTRSSGIFTQDMEDLVAAPVKPTDTITEPVTFTKSAAGNPTSADKHTLVKEPSEQAADPISSVASPEFIDAGQSANFHRMFRDSLKPKHRKDADNLAHEWLRTEGIIDVLGKPSALAIRKDSFYDVREKAMEYANQYANQP